MTIRSTLPPAGAPNSCVLFPDRSTYRVYPFHVDFAVPANSTFTLFGSSPAAGFSQLFTSVPQLGGEGLGNLADRLMYRLAYRNFGDHESLVGNFTVRANNIAAIRWFELRGVTAGPITTFQDSSYQPDTADWRWMGSLAMDKFANMALGFSASSAAIHPQIRYTGRLGTDPINTMTQGEGHIFDGAGSQVSTSGRWGDYSDLTVDPVDDQTFWFTTEYYDTTSSFNWRTRIANFKLATGGGGATLVSAASRLTHGSAGTFDVPMPLLGTSGVEDRDAAGSYLAVFTFNTAVTSGTASVVGGTGTAGAPTFSGNEMRVALTGVANPQILTVRVSGNGGATKDVPFGFLIADASTSRVVDKPDRTLIQGQLNMTVTAANFREDVNADGRIRNNDVQLVKTHRGESIP